MNPYVIIRKDKKVRPHGTRRHRKYDVIHRKKGTYLGCVLKNVLYSRLYYGMRAGEGIPAWSCSTHSTQKDAAKAIWDQYCRYVEDNPCKS